MEPSLQISTNLRSACVSEELGHLICSSSSRLVSLTVFSICGFTDMASNTAVSPSQSVSNLVESGLGRIVYFTALQQIIFNAGRVIIERVVRDPNRPTQASSSSQDLTSILKDGRGRYRWSMLSSSMGTVLRMFQSEVDSDDFAERESTKTPR